MGSQLKDMLVYRLDLSGDHTYVLSSFGTKKGKWTLANRLVTFEETSAEAPYGLMVADPMPFGEATPKGTRRYTAVLSTDGRKLSIHAGELGTVDFQR